MKIQPSYSISKASLHPPPSDSGGAALNGFEFFCLNAGLLLGNLLILFNTGAFASISLHATGNLGVSPSHASWIQTYYFVSLALALPTSGWIAARLGESRVFVAAMLLLASGSAVCSLAENLPLFLLGRVFQGFFGGIALPLSQTLLLREYPAAKKSLAVSIWSMAALSPFTLGPAVGGWIADTMSWRWLFHLNLPLALFSAGVVGSLGRETGAPSRRKPFDVTGFILLALSLACLQSVLNQGQDADWYNSPLIVGLAVAGLLALACFAAWELSELHPLIDLRLFRRRNFTVGTISLSLAFLLMYGLLSVLLVRLQSVAGYTSFLAGSVLLPLLIFTKPMASILHRVVHGFDARALASLNLLAFALFCLWTSTYDFFGRYGFFAQMLGSQILEGFCLGGLFVPLTTLFLSGLNPRRQLQAVDLGSMLRVLGGSAASPLLSVIWEQRAAFHQSRLIETLTVYDGVGREAISRLEGAGLPHSTTLALLARRAGQHAAVLGLDDAFRLAAWIFLALAAFVWLADPVKPAAPAALGEEARKNALLERVEEP